MHLVIKTWLTPDEIVALLLVRQHSDYFQKEEQHMFSDPIFET